MTLIGWLRKNRAARRYAREMAPWLRRSYGASEHYSIAQIRAAVAALGLNREFIGIAYAAFLPRDAYDALVAESPVRLAYEEARELFLRFVRPQLRSAYGEPQSNGNIVIGDGGSWSSGHGS